MITKTVGYAYPTSPLAKAKGFYKTGCHYVAVYDEQYPITEHDVIFACLTLEDAIDGANNLCSDFTPWGNYSFYKGE